MAKSPLFNNWTWKLSMPEPFDKVASNVSTSHCSTYNTMATKTLTRDYAFGQVSYITTYYVEDIPDDQLGYIVTEDFLAPAKGVPLVQRLYHDIFDEQAAAQSYAENLKPHDLQYPKSIVTFLVCNKGNVSQEKWYQQQKEAMLLMEEKGQTYLDESFCIFAKTHIENLKKLPTKEAA